MVKIRCTQNTLLNNFALLFDIVPSIIINKLNNFTDYREER